MAASTRGDLSKVSGPDSMAKPGTEASATAPAPSNPSVAPPETGKSRKKKRGGHKHRKKNRAQSFAATDENDAEMEDRPSLLDLPSGSAQQASLYRLQSGNRSNTSLESEALLDHTERGHMRNRKLSLQQQGFARPSLPLARHRASQTGAQRSTTQRSRLANAATSALSEDEDEMDANDRTPLLGTSSKSKSKPNLSRNNSGMNYGSHGAGRPRRSSVQSKASARRPVDVPNRGRTGAADESDDSYDVNNPPSVPNSPQLGSFNDVMIDRPSIDLDDERARDAIIDIEGDYGADRRYSSTSMDGTRRRATVADLAEADVCFPGHEDMSVIGEEDEPRSQQASERPKRRRPRMWPNLRVLEEWAREEKEERTQQDIMRAKKISEPVMVGGRLRPAKTVWHREEDDAPFRFTYFNEMYDGTIHARTIADLLQEGATYRDLFLPDPVELSDSSEEEEENDNALQRPSMGHVLNGHLGAEPNHQGEMGQHLGDEKRSPSTSKSATGTNTPIGRDRSGTPRPRKGHSDPKGNGARPTWWLDVLSPTQDEMRVLSRAFGIHQLTSEDIMMQEPREKVELFSNYYFVNYRSFEQDSASETHMEPVSIYVVVFRDGVISFHHTMTPHPANVRRRIRQLNDYMSPTADWISYALIDDVTDVFAPLVGQIEDEVDEIDDDILYLHQRSADALPDDVKGGSSKGGKSQTSNNEKSEPTTQADMGAEKAEGEKTAGRSGSDMLRRVGECRKKVMGLYRLLGNKADVIKGFAKRCNEHWEVAPRSEIGMYLGDIQDHIVTMTGNLSHYENLLSRAHSNYLAQINIRMNERAEQTADILGKLTVVGTIVLPMNIITGMWGMNVWVPGQGAEEDLTWFWCITAGLLGFGLTCYFVAKKVYGIV